MLVLTRKVSEKINIGNNIVITLLRIQGNNCRIGIEAPTDVKIRRAEIAHLPPKYYLGDGSTEIAQGLEPPGECDLPHDPGVSCPICDDLPPEETGTPGTSEELISFAEQDLEIVEPPVVDLAGFMRSRRVKKKAGDNADHS